MVGLSAYTPTRLIHVWQLHFLVEINESWLIPWLRGTTIFYHPKFQGPSFLSLFLKFWELAGTRIILGSPVLFLGRLATTKKNLSWKALPWISLRDLRIEWKIFCSKLFSQTKEFDPKMVLVKVLDQFSRFFQILERSSRTIITGSGPEVTSTSEFEIKCWGGRMRTGIRSGQGDSVRPSEATSGERTR